MSQGLTNRDGGLLGGEGGSPDPNEAAGIKVIENKQIGLHGFHRIYLYPRHI